MALDLKRGVLRALEAVPPLGRRVLASTDYELLPIGVHPDEVFKTDGWEDPSTAQRQDRAWSRLTDQAVSGRPREDIQALVDAVQDTAPSSARVLEVGCGSGYFSRIIAHSRPDISYVGVDYSIQMIELARQRYAGRNFVVGDATQLDFSDDSFDLLIDGAALIHIPQWEKALSEYSRVSRGPLVLSSLTLTETGSTRVLRKRAYGSPVIEFIFSRRELEGTLGALGVRVRKSIRTLDYNLADYVGIPTTSELWICE